MGNRDERTDCSKWEHMEYNQCPWKPKMAGYQTEKAKQETD